MDLFINLFKKMFSIKAGTFAVKHGRHEVFIPLNLKGTESVWMRITAINHNHGCGGGKVDEVGCVVLPTGLMFVVFCHTESCSVDWIVE